MSGQERPKVGWFARWRARHQAEPESASAQRADEKMARVARKEGDRPLDRHRAQVQAESQTWSRFSGGPGAGG